MGKLLKFKRKHGEVPAFEAGLARLQEELALTDNFATQMVREGYYKAATAVIEEQQQRIDMHHEAMRRAFRPRARRTYVALGGIAAIMLIGSASVALVGFSSDSTPSAVAVIHRVEQKIASATVAKNSAEARNDVNAAIGEMSALQGQSTTDLTPQIDPSLLSQLSAQLGELQNQPGLANLIKTMVDVARKSQVQIPQQPKQPAAPKQSAPSNPTSPPAAPH
ncbi:MAG: hypothetical protein ACYDCC_14050 [Actinomycetota bacterium]